jgi:hypothetical protein
MKSNIKIPVLLFLVTISSVIYTKQVSAQQTNVSFQVFYDQLSPYGEWVNYPNYGYVWIPNAGSDFVPYSTQGHWLLTDYGWTWMSDYSWGWAPFHYGRWDFDHYYGWFWVPDNEWGPAWVSWRRAEGYYGWAPMETGISLSASFNRGYDSHDDHWIFVKDRDIDRSDINHYYINKTDQYQIVRRSSVINGTYVDSKRHTTYVTGPARADFQKVAGRKVNSVAIVDNNKPGQSLNNGHFSIYRPEVAKNNTKDKKPVPAKIADLKDIKQPTERNTSNSQAKLNPANNIKDVKKSTSVNPQSASNNVKPALSQKSNPPQNIKTVNQPDNVKTINTTQSQNLNKASQHNNVKPANPTTTQNIKKEEHPANAKALNPTPVQNIKREEQPVNAKTFQPTTSQNVRRDLQPNNVKTMNTNSSQNAGKAKQPKAIKVSEKNNIGDQKKSNSSEEIK